MSTRSPLGGGTSIQSSGAPERRSRKMANPGTRRVPPYRQSASTRALGWRISRRDALGNGHTHARRRPEAPPPEVPGPAGPRAAVS
ncbi:MAG: hypothetical protein OXU61_00465 [Gammaproteobacteria bacterium]|nr:hypothetical protein [Gammaproteobacteria bacterium]